MEWGDGHRPADTFVVVMLLDRGRHQSSGAYTIATHDNWLRDAILVEKIRVQCLSIFRSQFEDVPDLDAPHKIQLAATLETAVAFLHITNIVNSIERQVALEIRVAHMVAGLVRAHHKIGSPAHG